MFIPFSALIENGDIHLVRDRRLRALLPAYVNEIESRTRTVDGLNQARATVFTMQPMGEPDYGAPLRARGTALRARPERVREAMLRLLFFNHNTVGNYRIMLRATTELRVELERVLGERPVPLPVPRIRRDSF